ncbi:MAG: hypothetical protein QG605_1273 [Euryarchaeota archaeon]|nr:hypothetical protein [Euryarchaeota archaeon]
MTAYVTMHSMTKRFALITHRFTEFYLHLGEVDQINSLSAARNMETVRPGRGQKFAGSRWSVAGITHVGARARACDAHGHAGARGKKAKVRDEEVERW